MIARDTCHLASCPLLLLAQEVGVPDINVVCERLTVGGLPTRFEDQARLPVRPASICQKSAGQGQRSASQRTR